MAVDYLLHESAVGYALFQVTHQPDTVGNRLQEFQATVQDLSKFGKMVKLNSFSPFQGAAQALENTNEISEGLASQFLLSLLEMNLPKTRNVTLGVADKTLAGSIRSSLPHIRCVPGDSNEIVQDLLRGIRLHAHKLLKQLQDGDVERAQLGLGHAYSRARVKFSVQKNDNHIIQAIALLDHFDKAVNTFSMRVREWYSWHFPELIRIASDNQTYAKLALFIGDKKRLSEQHLEELTTLCNGDVASAQSIIDAAKVSMGQDLSEADMENVTAFANRVVNLATCRTNLHNYLIEKMGIVAPNLASLLGEVIGARLISHAGSLTSLAKYPASTVQILGAEKALFRALKTKGNTPKYGLLYHSSFIGKAALRNKGRISRLLANKCSIASRIDNFSEQPTRQFGEALKAQVEERLAFYDNGVAPTKNTVVMERAMDAVLADIHVDDPNADGEGNQVREHVTHEAAPETEGRKKTKKSKGDHDGKKEKKKRKHPEGVNSERHSKEKKKKKKHQES